MKKLILIIAIVFSGMLMQASVSKMLNKILGESPRNVDSILSNYPDYYKYNKKKINVRIDEVRLVLKLDFDHYLEILSEVKIQVNNRDIIQDMPQYDDRRVGSVWTDYTFFYKPVITFETTNHNEGLKHFESIDRNHLYLLKHKKKNKYIVARILLTSKGPYRGSFIADDKAIIDGKIYGILLEK